MRSHLSAQSWFRPLRMQWPPYSFWAATWANKCACALTIVGGGREAWVVCGRGTQSILRARGRWLAWSSGPSTSPLDVPVSLSQDETLLRDRLRRWLDTQPRGVANLIEKPGPPGESRSFALTPT